MRKSFKLKKKCLYYIFTSLPVKDGCERRQAARFGVSQNGAGESLQGNGESCLQTQPTLRSSTATSQHVLGRDLEWEEMPLCSVRGGGKLGGEARGRCVLGSTYTGCRGRGRNVCVLPCPEQGCAGFRSSLGFVMGKNSHSAAEHN